MKKIAILCALATATAIASPAAAQDASQDANYGTLQLPAGFTPDPRVVRLTAGGDRDSTRLGSGCAGYVSNAPDVKVAYGGGAGNPLIFRVTSDADTMLVINGPDGRWHCNDDANGLNPGLIFRNAGAGTYDVWVGMRFSRSGSPANLAVSEIER